LIQYLKELGIRFCRRNGHDRKCGHF